jgi:hypothetical protein
MALTDEQKRQIKFWTDATRKDKRAVLTPEFYKWVKDNPDMIRDPEFQPTIREAKDEHERATQPARRTAN